MTGVAQKTKPVQGASPQKLHTTYKLHTHTESHKTKQINNYKNETYTQIKKILTTHNLKTKNVLKLI